MTIDLIYHLRTTITGLLNMTFHKHLTTLFPTNALKIPRVNESLQSVNIRKGKNDISNSNKVYIPY